MPTLTQCFSALVASGNGQKCNEFRSIIRDRFLVIEENTGKHKSFIFKFGYEQHPTIHKKLRMEVGKMISSIYDDIDPVFFGPDLGA